MKQKDVVLSGYDEMAVVFDQGNYVIREVFEAYSSEAQELYHAFREYGLSQYSIVDTEIISSNDGKSTSFRHRKHIITYPHEWTASMYKDAVLFHLELLLNLDKHGMTLKDTTPNNILFDGAVPVFVDFMSLVRVEDLIKQKWAFPGASKYQDARYDLFEKMFVPYLLIPLFGYARQEHALTREMLKTKFCNNPEGLVPNVSDYQNWDEYKYQVKRLIKKIVRPSVNERHINLKSMQNLVKVDDLIEYSTFLKTLHDSINNLDVKCGMSGYSTYYQDKRHGIDLDSIQSWTMKQKSIYEIMDGERPGRVLDLGANTGWYSILAEHLGASVIATEIDEASVDALYLKVKSENLNIIPINVSFEDLGTKIFGKNYVDDIYQGRDYAANPLFLEGTRRFESDTVLCLGLTHHLIIGLNISLEKILEILSALTAHSLIYEFVDLEDNRVQDPENREIFFKYLYKYNKDNYNIGLVLDVGKKYFTSATVLDSDQDTRKLIHFRK